MRGEQKVSSWLSTEDERGWGLTEAGLEGLEGQADSQEEEATGEQGSGPWSRKGSIPGGLGLAQATRASISRGQSLRLRKPGPGTSFAGPGMK